MIPKQPLGKKLPKIDFELSGQPDTTLNADPQSYEAFQSDQQPKAPVPPVINILQQNP